MSFQDDQVFLEKYLDEHINTVLGLRLAETYISTDNLEGAHQTLTEFLESHPDNATATFLLGEIAFKEGDNEKARNLYEETIQADPSYSAAYHRLVTISTDNGDQITVKEIYALLNRLNPLDSRAVAEVGDKDSDVSFKSDFSKKVLNQFMLTTAEPDGDSEILQDTVPIEPAMTEEDEENIITSESYTEPENIPLGGEDGKTEVEVEELSDEEGSFDLDSAGETEESDESESEETSTEETVMTDSEDSDVFGVAEEPDETIDSDNEADSELPDAEESIESEIKESEEDNPFGVGEADEADTEKSEEDSEEAEEEIEESAADEETTETEGEDPFASEEVAEDSAQDEESADEQPEDESLEESEENADEAEQTELQNNPRRPLPNV